ncbi:MAG TPA: hypothetical protein VN181_05330 [Thermoanaerobaculia bacterium]|nr:hypothetical protein [Thermoanaerobaculia bacterium]
MKFDIDFALRSLIVLAGVLSAILLSIKGQTHALPALAIGGTVGACFMARFGPSEDS